MVPYRLCFSSSVRCADSSSLQLARWAHWARISSSCSSLCDSSSSRRRRCRHMDTTAPTPGMRQGERGGRGKATERGPSVQAASSRSGVHTGSLPHSMGDVGVCTASVGPRRYQIFMFGRVDVLTCSPISRIRSSLACAPHTEASVISQDHFFPHKPPVFENIALPMIMPTDAVSSDGFGRTLVMSLRSCTMLLLY